MPLNAGRIIKQYRGVFSAEQRTRSMRVIVLGSFPPRECGIATFTKDVVDNLGARDDVQCEVIAIDESGGETRVRAAGCCATPTRRSFLI